jgi:hypothetical protein
MRRVVSSFILIAVIDNLNRIAGNNVKEEDEIRDLTDQFRKVILQGDLTVLDRIFDTDPSNVYYDISEGPLVGNERLKRVWRAATRKETGKGQRIFSSIPSPSHSFSNGLLIQ